MMERQDENRAYTELKCGDNIAYILKDNSMFLTTEYKVLQSQTGGCFLRSMKMLYNGRIQLYYMTDSWRPLSALLPLLSSDRFLAVASSLLSAVEEVKNNGFLSCRNLELSGDRIYVDMNTSKVRLIYLPVSVPVFQDETAFETELRAELLREVNQREDRTLPEMVRLAENLSDGTLSLGDLGRVMRGETVRPRKEPEPPQHIGAGTLYLVAMNAPVRAEVKVTKDEFVIGKNPAAVDAALTFSKMISRVHCKISRSGSGYTVMDLNSSNGTFVNRQRLTPQRPYSVKNGDVVRIASTDFQVIIR